MFIDSKRNTIQKEVTVMITNIAEKMSALLAIGVIFMGLLVPALSAQETQVRSDTRSILIKDANGTTVSLQVPECLANSQCERCLYGTPAGVFGMFKTLSYADRRIESYEVSLRDICMEAEESTSRYLPVKQSLEKIGMTADEINAILNVIENGADAINKKYVKGGTFPADLKNNIANAGRELNKIKKNPAFAAAAIAIADIQATSEVIGAFLYSAVASDVAYSRLKMIKSIIYDGKANGVRVDPALEKALEVAETNILASQSKIGAFAVYVNENLDNITESSLNLGSTLAIEAAKFSAPVAMWVGAPLTTYNTLKGISSQWEMAQNAVSTATIAVILSDSAKYTTVSAGDVSAAIITADVNFYVQMVDTFSVGGVKFKDLITPGHVNQDLAEYYKSRIVEIRGSHSTMRTSFDVEGSKYYSSIEVKEPPEKWKGIGKKSITAGKLRFLGEVPTTDIEKLVVLIHGWNPSTKPQDAYGRGEWKMFCDAWLISHVLYNDWEMVLYDWRKDASTGAFPKAHKGTAAAEAAYLHGWFLAEEIKRRYPKLKQIQFIAHSAGSWAARSAALGLKNCSGLSLQVTLLDAYVPIWLSDDPGYDVPDSLTRNKMQDINPEDYNIDGDARMIAVESYFHKDYAFGTNSAFPWSGPNTRQTRIERDSLQSLVTRLEADERFSSSPKWYDIVGNLKQSVDIFNAIVDVRIEKEKDKYSQGHSLPIAWYAASMLEPHCYVDGWAQSMPYQKADRTVSVVAVVDESGSMSGRKKTLAGAGVSLLAQLLYKDSEVSELGIVGFSKSARRVCPLLPKSGADEIRNGVGSLRASGGTAIGAGLAEGLRCVLEGSSSRRSLVLLSDGMNNVGTPWPIVEKTIEAQVPVYTVGLETSGEASHALEKIAAKTGGDYFGADIDNIQQVYAAIRARMNGMCIPYYKTDVVQQGEVRDFRFDASALLASVGDKVTSLRVILAWPGSRLGLSVLDGSGIDVTDQVLVDVERTSTTLSGRLEGLIPQEYMLNVTGEEVSGEGEPFSLQIQGHGVPAGIYVKPPSSEYRVGEKVVLSGYVPDGTVTGLAFNVKSPSGAVTDSLASMKQGVDGSSLWRVDLPPPESPGIYEITGQVEGRNIFTGSYRCGTVKECLSDRISTLSLLDRTRLAVRRGAQTKNDRSAALEYASLTWATHCVRATQAFGLVQKKFESSSDDHNVKDRRFLELLLPFVGRFGLDFIAFERAGLITACTHWEWIGGSSLMNSEELVTRKDNIWWVRVPLANESMPTAVLLGVLPADGEDGRRTLSSFLFRNSFESWCFIDKVVDLQAACITVPLMVGIEKVVLGHHVDRDTALRVDQALAGYYQGYFGVLLVQDSNGGLVFSGAGGDEGGEDRYLFAVVSEPVKLGGRAVETVTARIVLGETAMSSEK